MTTESLIADTIAHLAVPLSDLTPFPGNSRRGDVSKLMESLQHHRQFRPIVVNRRGNVVLAGNHTYAAMQQLGSDSIAVTYVDVDEEQATQINLVDNRLNDIAEYDTDALVAQLESLPDLVGTGFDESDLAQLITEMTLPPVALTDPDAVPGPPADPITKRGDVILMGKHRLMCGDSTVLTDVERLMDGKQADMVWTDPPYGVEYIGGLNLKKRQMLVNDDTDIYSESVPMMALATTDTAPLYLWFADRAGKPAYDAVHDSGYAIRAMIVWHKMNAHYGNFMAQYMMKHEPCLYCYKAGQSPTWYGATNEVTVWDIDQPSKNELHPTQKPVELATRAITNSSEAGTIVLDLFAGSGTLLIAAEQSHRIAYLMELDPKYCDVIVNRWQDFTGQIAQRPTQRTS